MHNVSCCMSRCRVVCRGVVLYGRSPVCRQMYSEEKYSSEQIKYPSNHSFWQGQCQKLQEGCKAHTGRCNAAHSLRNSSLCGNTINNLIHDYGQISVAESFTMAAVRGVTTMPLGATAISWAGRGDWEISLGKRAWADAALRSSAETPGQLCIHICETSLAENTKVRLVENTKVTMCTLVENTKVRFLGNV